MIALNVVVHAQPALLWVVNVNKVSSSAHPTLKRKVWF